jgi:hypothetical protein
MRSTLSKILGVTFIIAAVAGLIFSLFALVKTWQLRASLTDDAVNTLTLLDTTLNTTLDGLSILDSTLVTATSNIAGLQLTTDNLALAVQNTQPILDSVTNLVGQDLPATITATQTSLASAASSALLIDNLLTTLSRIPLLGLGRYQPDVPLNVALRDVSLNLSKIPATLAALKSDLSNVGQNLTLMQTSISAVSANLQEINTSLGRARSILSDYRITVVTFDLRVQSALVNLPKALKYLAWALTFFFVWLVVVQVALFLQGMSLLGMGIESTASGE